ncbi:MAG: hypothetical protein PUC39_08100 [Lachnospiraceae bacterium]|nr:hypothetical protein [Lachnospiraceae bacterium]
MKNVNKNLVQHGMAVVLCLSLCLNFFSMPVVKAAGMAVDASFDDWSEVEFTAVSGNLSKVGMVVQGDYVYVYAREGDNNNSSISWGQQLAFVTEDGKKIDFNAYQTSYGWQEAVRTLNLVDGSGQSIGDASGMGAYLTDSNCYQWEMRFPLSLFGDAQKVALTDASGQQVYVKELALKETSQEPVTTEQPATTEETTQKPATTEETTQKPATTEQPATTTGIVIDGYYEDWTNIDVKDALTWYSNNKLCHHKAGIYMDDENVYVHVKMNDLYTSQIPLTDFHLKINGEQDVAFGAQFQKEDGSVDWSGDIYNLPEGITQLAVFYNGYPKHNMGDLNVTIYNDQHKGDEFEFQVSLKVLSQITGIPVESIKSVSFSCNNIGGNSITTSGTSTGAVLGVVISILAVGLVLCRRKRKRVQE